MSDAPSDEKNSSSSPALPDMTGLPVFKIPSEMRLSRQWDQAIERFATNGAVGTGMLALMHFWFFRICTDPWIDKLLHSCQTYEFEFAYKRPQLHFSGKCQIEHWIIYLSFECLLSIENCCFEQHISFDVIFIIIFRLKRSYKILKSSIER